MIESSFVNHFGLLFSGALYFCIALLQIWEVCVVVIFWATLVLVAMFAMFPTNFENVVGCKWWVVA